MAKKIIILIVMLILLAGSACGIYFGIQYYNIKDSSQYEDSAGTVELVNELRDKIVDLNTEMTKLQAKYETLKQNNDSDKEELAKVKNDLDKAKKDIKFYQELLEAYENSGKYEVVFYLVQNGEQTPYDVQVVEPNGYLSDVVEPEGNFEGWSLTIGGDLIESLTSVQITEDTNIYGTFYSTVTFMVNDEEYSTQQVGYNKYATEEEPEVQYYTFEGWTLNGEDVVAVNTYPITQDTTFVAKLTKNELSTFIPKTWNISELVGSAIWSYENNIYFAHLNLSIEPYSVEHYILNKETGNWDVKSWNIENLSFNSGQTVWTDGEEIYISSGQDCQYVLNKETGNWDVKSWNIEGMVAIFIWSDGTNYYYSHGTDQYVLNKETGNWDVKIWNGIDSFYGNDVWTDGSKIYISEDDGANYVLNNETDTWSEQLWNIDNIIVESIWNNGDIVYYSHGTDQYVLNKETGNWDEKVWNGITEFDGYDIWTDGENFYYSNGTQQYVIV